MSDDSYTWACPDLVGDAARSALDGLRADLAGRGVIEDRLAECILSEELGYPPGPNVGEALTLPPTEILRLHVNGVEMKVGREVVAPWGDGYEGTRHTCPACGATHLFDDEVDLGEIGLWFEGEIDEAAIACPSCGHRSTFDEIDLVPPWCLAQVVVRVWNWATPQPWFIDLVASHLTPRSISFGQRV